jgi:hypothetical protein
MSNEKPMGQVIQIDEARIRDHLGEMVRGTVEETKPTGLGAVFRLPRQTAQMRRTKISAQWYRSPT